ncbi:HPr family phosphocarrier protein [Butyricicoccus pullicaecorum]|jgi:phosphocarrier protein|uniref:HPr family phosphocarrier n=2 Tax=Butyricicoccus pullicaecorum TaxID=501571 RepID=R8W1Y8_9FIRM|nr:HPr family phosphocarrier protein [Butyricicoccus pullicaecorum]EOQ38536.1 HPr family phosphocarrier [Butyricicoccus pullicaecorum 1.2]MBS5280351.1 HPr family phosphocarrier protein [Butyricicoccus pullicaecorum]MDY2969782.1 HPr family phosphocarrier protein [Butyricicoccus pullicaecorum]OUP51719.1 PTS galactitol transporter subunit IIC [Butyricicoccus pullicaecorum]OUP56037.1 PTS galactitol transporter subunit IIC [Butyricicoccus pullicaecorum]
MKEFDYTIQDALGIHARPAGQLVKVVKGFSSKVTLHKDGKAVDATRLMSLMGMGVKQGDALHITVEGEDEAAACEALQKFFTENL